MKKEEKLLKFSDVRGGLQLRVKHKGREKTAWKYYNVWKLEYVQESLCVCVWQGDRQTHNLTQCCLRCPGITSHLRKHRKTHQVLKKKQKVSLIQIYLRLGHLYHATFPRNYVGEHAMFSRTHCMI